MRTIGGIGDASRRIVVALIALACVPPPTSVGPRAAGFPLRFDSEWIRLSIVGDSLEVRGTYRLLCEDRTRGSITLFYPFPHDSLLGGARMVSLRASAGRPTWIEIPGVWGVRWRLPPCTGDSIVVEAVYRQRLIERYARYIVTTTRAWDRPLRRAVFDVTLPPGAEPVGFSFPFVRAVRDGSVFYTFSADSFLPDRDIVVRW